MGKILLSIILSIDGLGIGASFGIAGTRITKSCYLAVFSVSLLVLELSGVAGEALTQIIPKNYTAFTGSLMLIAVGIVLIIREIKKGRIKSVKEKPIKPYKIWDMDNSGAIEMIEGVFLAVALSFDFFGAGIGLWAIYGDLGMLPVVMAISQTVFLYLGYRIGNRLFEDNKFGVWKDFIPSAVIIAVGLWGVKMCGKLI